MNFTHQTNKKKKTLQLLRRVSLLLELVKWVEIVIYFGVRLRDKILTILHAKYLELLKLTLDKEYYEMSKKIEEYIKEN